VSASRVHSELPRSCRTMPTKGSRAGRSGLGASSRVPPYLLICTFPRRTRLLPLPALLPASCKRLAPYRPGQLLPLLFRRRDHAATCAFEGVTPFPFPAPSQIITFLSPDLSCYDRFVRHISRFTPIHVGKQQLASTLMSASPVQICVRHVPFIHG
jgi:hypothetical protein